MAKISHTHRATFLKTGLNPHIETMLLALIALLLLVFSATAWWFGGSLSDQNASINRNVHTVNHSVDQMLREFGTVHEKLDEIRHSVVLPVPPSETFPVVGPLSDQRQIPASQWPDEWLK